MINDLRNALGWMAMKLREVLIVFIAFNNHEAVFYTVVVSSHTTYNTFDCP